MRALSPFLIVAASAALLSSGCQLRTPLAAPGTTFPPESPREQTLRRAHIAQRRQGPVVIVHRGAWAAAHENTLDAYAAAMDWGADGCEIDIRRTADGVLVCFHDDMLGELTNGIGAVEEITHEELQSLELRTPCGVDWPETHPPTLAAGLLLARERRMLLHLDIKSPDLDPDIARLIEAADVWDHIVAINENNAPLLRQHPNFRPLPYLGNLYDGRRDVDPDAVREMLPSPGQMVIVDDPRLVAHLLGRELQRPTRPPERVRETGDRVALAVRSGAQDVPPAQEDLEELSTEALIEIVHEPPEHGGDPARIHRRARAAQRLGERERSPESIAALEHLVRHRTFHPNWRLHAVDGAQAVRALAHLGAVDAIPRLVLEFWRVDPRLAGHRTPEYPDMPTAWLDWRLRRNLLQAFGHLPHTDTQRALQRYVDLPPEDARALSFEMHDVATRALLCHPLRDDELTPLLHHPNSTVRGTAILWVLDKGSDAQRALLTALHPWTAALLSSGQSD